MYTDEKIDIDQVTDAIAAFRETLTTPNSRLNQWLNGYDKSISESSWKDILC
jgi:cytochrome c peroxidase